MPQQGANTNMYADQDTLVTIFFVLRLVTLAILLSVLRIQVGLFKRPVPQEVNTTRKIMVTTIVVMVAAQVLPIFIDLIVLLTPENAADWLVLYRGINIVSTLVAAGGFWLLYQDVKRN